VALLLPAADETRTLVTNNANCKDLDEKSKRMKISAGRANDSVEETEGPLKFYMSLYHTFTRRIHWIYVCL